MSQATLEKRESKALTHLLAWTPRSAAELQRDAYRGRQIRRLATLLILLGFGFGAFAAINWWHGAALATRAVQSNIINALDMIGFGGCIFMILDWLGWNLVQPLKIASRGDLDTIGEGLATCFDAPGMGALADRIMAEEPMYAANARPLAERFRRFREAHESADQARFRAEQAMAVAEREPREITEYRDAMERLTKTVGSTFPTNQGSQR